MPFVPGVRLEYHSALSHRGSLSHPTLVLRLNSGPLHTHTPSYTLSSLSFLTGALSQTLLVFVLHSFRLLWLEIL